MVQIQCEVCNEYVDCCANKRAFIEHMQQYHPNYDKNAKTIEPRNSGHSRIAERKNSFSNRQEPANACKCKCHESKPKEHIRSRKSLTGLVEKKNKNDSAPVKKKSKPQSKERNLYYILNNKVIEADVIKKRRLYKATVEKWRPGYGKIVCPKCGAKKRPQIISQPTKRSHLATGAVCLSSCLPFCVLPCFSPPSTDYLHCSVCGYYLGVYDHQKSVIHPNEKLLHIS